MKDRCVDLEPRHNIGPAGQRSAERDEDAERAADRVRIARDNGAGIIAEAQGYTVRGAALSGVATEKLEAGSGIRSRTLASYGHARGKERDELTGRDVLVVDEAVEGIRCDFDRLDVRNVRRADPS